MTNELDGYTLPGDLRNYGVKCRDCNNPDVVYYIAVPAKYFPTGAYCYKCLLVHCRAAHRIPLPMETEMLDRVRRDLGLDQAATASAYLAEM